ncbi:PcfJ domain-containing protein [Enterococcus hirae]|uniref:PcfJ domain-containing protein n=1 Tax=Enterococcus hirae TaxID=1354 RepID=UPI003CE5900C
MDTAPFLCHAQKAKRVDRKYAFATLTLKKEIILSGLFHSQFFGFVLHFYHFLVVMPRNLEVKHDEAVNVFNQLKIELEEKAYRERLEKIKKLEQEIDEYMFLVPKKLEEIVEEGKNLNHCVGSYVEKHKTGETTIIFMRKKESQDQSLYTIEYKNKHIVQIQGYKNKEVIPEKVREVANKWVKKIS